MAHAFIITSLSALSENVIETRIDVEGTEYMYLIERKEIGYKIPGELSNLLAERVRRSQNFIKLIYDFQDGVLIKLPLDLSCFHEI
jgi:hypothetical protein